MSDRPGADHETLELRRNSYLLISEVFARLPDAELVESFRQPSVVGPITELGFDLGLEELPEDAREAADVLRVEFTRLFIAGPGERVARFGSLYGEPQERATLWSDSTSEVGRAMKSVGLPAPEGRIPDHVSVEMRFLSRLIAKRIDALAKGDTRDAAALERVEREFLDTYVRPWIPTFCDLVERLAKLRFYGAYAGLTRKFLELS